jgi:hypothetical protein
MSGPPLAPWQQSHPPSFHEGEGALGGPDFRYPIWDFIVTLDSKALKHNCFLIRSRVEIRLRELDQVPARSHPLDTYVHYK